MNSGTDDVVVVLDATGRFGLALAERLAREEVAVTLRRGAVEEEHLRPGAAIIYSDADGYAAATLIALGAARRAPVFVLARRDCPTEVLKLGFGFVEPFDLNSVARVIARRARRAAST